MLIHLEILKRVLQSLNLSHSILDGKINQPKTIGYLDPFCDIRYGKYKNLDIKFEYRVLAVNGQIELMYLKDNSQGKFVGNLSHLHWENSKAKKVTDLSLPAKIHKFIEPIFKTLGSFWCGLDVLIDQNEKIWLIELNTSPGFSYYLESNILQSTADLYRGALTKYFNLN